MYTLNQSVTSHRRLPVSIAVIYLQSGKSDFLRGFDVCMGSWESLLSVFHLLYGDDSIILGYLRGVLLCFEAMSGFAGELSQVGADNIGEATQALSSCHPLS